MSLGSFLSPFHALISDLYVLPCPESSVLLYRDSRSSVCRLFVLWVSCGLLPMILSFLVPLSYSFGVLKVLVLSSDEALRLKTRPLPSPSHPLPLPAPPLPYQVPSSSSPRPPPSCPSSLPVRPPSLPWSSPSLPVPPTPLAATPPYPSHPSPWPPPPPSVCVRFRTLTGVPVSSPGHSRLCLGLRQGPRPFATLS